MVNFPNLTVSEKEKTQQWCKQWMDAIDEYYRSSDNRGRISKIYRNYNSHNGTITKEIIELNQNKFGSALSTDLKDYFIGRTKISSLVGEWLDMPLVANVLTTNRESIIKKLNNFKILYGAIAAKREVSAVQEKTGWSVMNDMKVPDMPETATSDEIKTIAAYLNPKTNNEVIMQTILNDKIRRGKMKMVLIESIKDLLLTSEIHGKIDRDTEGKDYFRPIPAPYAIFEENIFDYNCSRSPFRGEYRPLYEHEVIQLFNLSPTEIKSLQGEYEQGGYEFVNDQRIIPVIYGEIKTTRPIITKTSKDKKGKKQTKELNPVEYQSSYESITNDIALGRYEITVEYKEDMWEGVKIGRTIYKNMRRKENQIQVKGRGKYHRAKSDYISYLVGTVNGRRIAVQEVIANISEVYNFLMWQILREIKKNKGKTFVYDEALMPNSAKGIKAVLYDIEENNVIRINSAEDGNVTGKDIDMAAKVITALDLGLSNSFPTMLETKRELERTLDKLTGVSEAREGFGKATETATATNSRLEGSRNVTGELFYSFNEFINEMLIILAEKTKLNEEYLENEGQYILGDDQRNFIMNTKNVAFDEYGVYLTNGKKEMEVKAMVRQYFPVEINAGKLRTKDVAAFELADSLSEGLAILEKAWAVVKEFENSANASKEKMQQEQIKAAKEEAIANREDTQAHEKELVQMKIDADANKNVTKVAGDQIKNLDNIQSSERIADVTQQSQTQI